MGSEPSACCAPLAAGGSPEAPAPPAPGAVSGTIPVLIQFSKIAPVAKLPPRVSFANSRIWQANSMEEFSAEELEVYVMGREYKERFKILLLVDRLKISLIDVLQEVSREGGGRGDLQ